MTTLHMNVSTATTTQSILAKTCQEITSNTSEINSAVSQMMDEWQGNSATEFVREYEEWLGKMRQVIDQLDDLSMRLRDEINQWETMASRMG